MDYQKRWDDLLDYVNHFQQDENEHEEKREVWAFVAELMSQMPKPITKDVWESLVAVVKVQKEKELPLNEHVAWKTLQMLMQTIEELKEKKENA